MSMGDFEGIEFGLIPEERYDEVIHHLRNNFFADEPLNHAVSLCRPGEPHAELEDHSLTTLKDGLSQMAVLSDTGKVSCFAADLLPLCYRVRTCRQMSPFRSRKLTQS
jgi:hypothetical protein